MLGPEPPHCLGDLMSQYRQHSMYDALFAHVSQRPLLSLPLLSDVGQNLDNVWPLDLFMFADITGAKRSVLNVFGHGQSTTRLSFRWQTRIP